MKLQSNFIKVTLRYRFPLRTCCIFSEHLFLIKPLEGCFCTCMTSQERIFSSSELSSILKLCFLSKVILRRQHNNFFNSHSKKLTNFLDCLHACKGLKTTIIIQVKKLLLNIFSFLY